MKRNTIKAVLMSMVVLLLSSCATFSGLEGITDAVTIDSPKDKIVRNVEGSATVVYFFGLGGGNAEKRAIDELKENAKLEEGQYLTNYHIFQTESIIFGGVFIVKNITATADVVQLSD